MNTELTTKIQEYIKNIRTEETTPYNYNGRDVAKARKEGLVIIRDLVQELETIKKDFKPRPKLSVVPSVVKFVKKRSKAEVISVLVISTLLLVNSFNSAVINKQGIIISKQGNVITKNVQLIDSLAVDQTKKLEDERKKAAEMLSEKIKELENLKKGK